jgi:hypothetical protein
MNVQYTPLSNQDIDEKVPTAPVPIPFEKKSTTEFDLLSPSLAPFVHRIMKGDQDADLARQEWQEAVLLDLQARVEAGESIYAQSGEVDDVDCGMTEEKKIVPLTTTVETLSVLLPAQTPQNFKFSYIYSAVSEDTKGVYSRLIQGVFTPYISDQLHELPLLTNEMIDLLYHHFRLIDVSTLEEFMEEINSIKNHPLEKDFSTSISEALSDSTRYRGREFTGSSNPEELQMGRILISASSDPEIFRFFWSRLRKFFKLSDYLREVIVMLYFWVEKYPCHRGLIRIEILKWLKNQEETAAPLPFNDDTIDQVILQSPFSIIYALTFAGSFGSKVCLELFDVQTIVDSNYHRQIVEFINQTPAIYKPLIDKYNNRETRWKRWMNRMKSIFD